MLDMVGTISSIYDSPPIHSSTVIDCSSAVGKLIVYFSYVSGV